MKKGKHLEVKGYSRPSELPFDVISKKGTLHNIRRLQKKVVGEGFGIKVGDKVRPKKEYRQRGIDHSGIVISIKGFCCDIKLGNDSIMKDIAVSYLEKMKQKQEVE